MGVSDGGIDVQRGGGDIVHIMEAGFAKLERKKEKQKQCTTHSKPSNIKKGDTIRVIGLTDEDDGSRILVVTDIRCRTEGCTLVCTVEVKEVEKG